MQSEEERAAAESSKQALAESGVFGTAIVVLIEDFDSFWYAEEYHQDYYLKNPGHYNRTAGSPGAPASCGALGRRGECKQTRRTLKPHRAQQAGLSGGRAAGLWRSP